MNRISDKRKFWAQGLSTKLPLHYENVDPLFLILAQLVSSLSILFSEQSSTSFFSVQIAQDTEVLNDDTVQFDLVKVNYGDDYIASGGIYMWVIQNNKLYRRHCIQSYWASNTTAWSLSFSSIYNIISLDLSSNNRWKWSKSHRLSQKCRKQLLNGFIKHYMLKCLYLFVA